MAGRSSRSKTQLTVQQRESQCRAKWTTSLTIIMVNVMVDEVHKGHKQNKSFSKKGWKCISDEFQKRTGLTWERDQLKYRYAALRKLFATIKLLLEHTDFEWDETTGLITATDEAWDRYIKDHPDAETLRNTGCPFYKGLTVIFADSGSRGTYNGSTMHKDPLSGSLQEELSYSESEEGPDSNELEILQSVSSPTDISRKRGRGKGVDGAIARAISEMAAASRLRASAFKKCNDNFSITDCIRALDELEGVNDQVYYVALDLFNNHAAREIFLSLKVEKRLTWLIGKTSGPP
ncbi:L10-interacting MYB domain-containing protein-like [Lycium ferocissimum]|uniref:L10-interacting MYB domain-containing protein-like n=1 Tax=Lycium ferocissimum TaxID=112874 RepID=UPI002815FC97|nr:L10-interacting MYB domain-containing protein-like [Lycium ferocissimum]XP_059281097.1 L10-interacting MYB domain-containing protein-like [Lycium ferocissimum]